MKVLVAGATGALGRPTCAELLHSGHEVVGLTRSPEKAEALRGDGVEPALADVLDPRGLRDIVTRVKPEAVVQMLNALPKRGPMRVSELEGTNRLRTEGTKNLLAASVAAAASRFVVESMIFGYGYARAGERITEDQPFLTDPGIEEVRPALAALSNLEEQVLSAEIESVVLRYGLFYGPGVGSTQFLASLLRKRLAGLPGGGRGVGSWIHVEDGARAAVAALESAPANEVYNVVDDEPATLREFVEELARVLGLPRPWSAPLVIARLAGRYGSMVATSYLAVSNDKIKRDLGWQPRYPTIREGLRTVARPEDLAV